MLYASADVAGHRWAPDLDLLLIDQERPVIATLTGAGLRVSEAVALDWSDVNLATGTLRVGKAKTDAGFYREIDLPGGLVDELAEWKMRGADELATWTARNPDGGDPVFLSAHAGRIRRQSAANVARRLKTAIKSANKRLGELGIEPISDRVTPHSLRRTYASLRAASGDDPVYIAEQLGRTDPRFMLTVYTKAVKRRAKLSGEYSAEYERALAGAANDRKGRKWQKAEVDQQQVGLRGNPLTWLSRATYSILIVRGALAEWSPPHPVPTGHPSRPPRRSTWEPRRRTGWKKARRRAAQGALRGTPSTATGSAVPDVDSRLVERIDRLDGAFELTLQDGDVISARRVVIAAGLEPFAWRPPPLGELPPDLVSHSSDHADLGRLSGKRVMVIGAGQSALESAALLHESGADVEIVARAPGVVWLADEHHARIRAHMWRVLLPPTDVGGRVTGWMAAAPELLRRMPGGLRPAVTRRCIVPAGSAWLRSRLAHVPLVLDRAVVEAAPAGTGVRVVLDDGAVRKPDRVLLGTGFRLDVAKYRFLPPEAAWRPGPARRLSAPGAGPRVEHSGPAFRRRFRDAKLRSTDALRRRNLARGARCCEERTGATPARPGCRTSRGSASDPDPVSSSPGRCPEAPNSMRRLHSEASPKMQATGTGTVPARKWEVQTSSAIRAGLLSLVLVGMGMAIGLADGVRPSMVRLAGALLAIAIAVVFRRQRRLAVGTSLVLAGLILVAAGDSTTAGLDAALYAVCLLVFVVVGHRLVARVEDSLALSELGVAPGGAQGAPPMDALALMELSRARRAERSLSVAILALHSAGPRSDLGDVARAFAATLRCTDIVGYTGRNQFCVLFVETGRLAAIDALKRLERELEPAIAGRLSVGIASFPEDNPTWKGLRAAALERQRPLAEVELPGEEPVSELQAPSVANANLAHDG